MKTIMITVKHMMNIGINTNKKIMEDKKTMVTMSKKTTIMTIMRMDILLMRMEFTHKIMIYIVWRSLIKRKQNIKYLFWILILFQTKKILIIIKMIMRSLMN